MNVDVSVCVAGYNEIGDDQMTDSVVPLSLSEKDIMDLVDFVRSGPQDGLEVVCDDMIDHRRWDIKHRVIIKRHDDDTFWRGHYNDPATEMQFSDPDDTKRPLVRVKPVDKVVTFYETWTA